MNESEPTDDASRRQNMLSKPGNVEFPGMSIAEILFTGYTATVVEGA
jgi:hypothetical protein